MSFSPKQYFQFASQSLEFMAKHNISPRPSNYRVWFEYAAGSTPALTLAVETLERESKALNEDVSVSLHNEFFNHGQKLDDAVHLTGDILTEKLTSALELIQTAGKGTKAYGDALDNISSNLGTKSDDELSGDGLKSIVDTLVAATHEMSVHTKGLEDKLQENTREVEQLRENLVATKREAVTDQLTKLGNRKHFDIEMARAIQEAETDKKPFCLVMADIDKFKVFNDTWGHQTGDQVLRLVAACLGKEVRETDIPARYGGEEFALILPGTNLASAAIVAEKVRSAVESKKVMKRSTGEDLGTITISLGVSLFQPGEPMTSLIERADACLYAAKDAGRNCVISEDQGIPARKAS
jgi:diguanylate cyclase